MKLGEIKENTLKLLEEYSGTLKEMTDDTDIKNKLILGINSVIAEIAKIRAIRKSFSFFQGEIERKELPLDVNIVTKVEVGGATIHFWERKERYIEVLAINQQITVFYDAFPPIYHDSTFNTEILPFEDNVCVIIPYGVAKIVLMATGQGNEATECETKYYQYLQELTPSANRTVVKIKNIFGGSLYE